MAKLIAERSLAAGLAIGGAAAALAGCTTEVDRTLRVQQVAVRDEFDGTWTEDLELEVHVFDVDTAEFLGCSRGPKQRGGRFFKMRGASSRAGEWLTDLDVRDRELTFIVVENDDAACPDLYTYGNDELAGVSAELPGDEVAAGVRLAFDRVLALDVEGP